MLAGLQAKITAGLVAVAVVFGLYGYWQLTKLQDKLELERTRIISLQKELATAHGVNAANEAVLERLEASRDLDRQALKDMAGAVAAVSERAVQTRTIIREIERNDPVVADFLSLPLPDSLRNVINRRTGDADRVPDGEGSSPGGNDSRM